MTGHLDTSEIGLSTAELTEISTIAELAGMLRRLRRRHARQRGDSPLTYRELATKTGWAHGVIGGYFTGQTLAPTDRFDVLIELLGATSAEQYAMATARDRVEELRRAKEKDTPAVRRVPRELPSDVVTFTGRQSQVAELSSLLLADDTSAVVISAVAGTAGVGKTALAVHWAHQVGNRFPDGCLYVDLRGYGPDRPLRSDAALAMLLRSLGVPDAHVPHDPAERAARYRTMVAGLRMLIVFDNANSAEQVRPLLPGTASCRTIITSRDHLAGLVARDGARRIDLDVLPEQDSRQLLRSLIGARALADPTATATLADYCCGLPLALRIAAEYAIARPASPLAELVTELAAGRRRLDVLDARADQDTAIRAVFSWSYRALTGPTARAFRLIGLHPGRDLDVHAIAALIGDTVAVARLLVGELALAYLIRETAPGRYGMHDLLRAYAAEQAAVDTDREPALVRLYEEYLHTAGMAAGLAFPADAGQRPDVEPTDGPTRTFDTVAEALTWLDTERDNLVAVAVEAAEQGWPRYTTRLALTLGRYLYIGSHHDDALLLHSRARDAADTLGDRTSAAGSLRYLGMAHTQLTRYADAVDHLQQSLDVYRELGDGWGQGNVLTNLGIVDVRTGRMDEARRTSLAAVELHRASGNLFGEGLTLNNLGYVCTSLGRYEEALVHLRASLDLRRAAGEESGGTCTLSNLGSLHARLGQYAEALDCQRQALEAHRAVNDRVGEGEALGALGETYLRAGRYEEALGELGSALATSGETGERSLAARTRNALGETLLALGRTATATEHHESARAVAAEVGDGGELARAERGLGHVRADAGEWRAAREHWERALAGYAELGMPEADEMRELLRTPRQAEISEGGTG
jgi:tetratricopeptide (TPR) repeat protein